jgi:SAM-dependent methyltransferase
MPKAKSKRTGARDRTDPAAKAGQPAPRRKTRETREHPEPAPTRKTRETREPAPTRKTRKTRETREPREPAPQRETREPREPAPQRETREHPEPAPRLLGSRRSTRASQRETRENPEPAPRREPRRSRAAAPAQSRRENPEPAPRRENPEPAPVPSPPTPRRWVLAGSREIDVVETGSREHYEDAALYDYEYRRRRADVTFYRELARRKLGGPGRILDLGCGSGRVTVPLARDGHQVVAMDRSRPMLDRLRTRVAALPAAAAARITLVEGDLRSFEVPGEFPLIIAAFNVLEHLYTRSEVDACLRCVAAHLAPGGMFAFDVQLPDLAWLIRDPGKRWARTRFTDPTTGRRMVYSTNHDYDPISQIALIRLYYDPADPADPADPTDPADPADPADEAGHGHVVQLSQRKFFPAELEALVSHAGMRVIERFGDFYFGPLGPGAESQVLICQVAPTRR